MAAPSPLGDVKIVSPISTFVLNTLTLKKKVHFYFSSKAFVIYDHKSDMFFKIVGFAGKRILLPPSLPSPSFLFFVFFCSRPNFTRRNRAETLATQVNFLRVTLHFATESEGRDTTH